MQIPATKSCGLTGSALKLIAIITMTIDHIGAAVIEPRFLHAADTEQMLQILSTEAGMKLYLFDLIIRGIGRLAFPIFCFLLVEGFCHTRDVKKYLRNLVIFALISEVPFDLAFYDQAFFWGYQNIFFTLVIGLLTIMGIRQYHGNKAVQVLITLAGGTAAQLLVVDYGVMGVLIIVCFYVFRTNKKYKYISVGFLAVLESYDLFGIAALALLPIHRYNGERGTVRNKYAFYAYYPAHILILYLLGTFVFTG